MLEIAAILAVVFLGIAAYLFFENNSLRQRVVELDEAVKDSKSAGSKPAKATVEARAEKAEKKSSQKKSAKTEPAISEKEFEEARNEVKELKKQLFDVRAENKDLRKTAKAAEDRKPRVADSDVVFELREEIAQLKGEISRLETSSKGARAARPEPTPEPAPQPVAEAKPSAPARAADPAELVELREKLEAEMEAVRREARKEVADAEKRLKKTAANVDKQRRRADNNDRAYKITQRQLDATQERLDLLQEQLKKGGSGVTPTPVAAAPKPAPKPEPKAEVKPEPKAEVKPEPKAEVKPEPTPEPKPEPKAEAAPEQVAAKEEAPAESILPASSAVLRRPARPAEEPVDATVKSRPVSEADVAAATTPAPDVAEESQKAEEDRGNTEVLSGAAVSAILSDEGEKKEEAVAASEETPAEAASEEGKRPSSGLFGMPGSVLRGDDEEAEEVDPNRSTQFAFPAQQGGLQDAVKRANEGNETSKFVPVKADDLKTHGQEPTGLSDAKLASFAVDDDDDKDSELAGGSSTMDNKRLGEDLSDIDDAWADLDID